MDRGGDKLLVLEGLHQRGHQAGAVGLRLGDGLEGDGLVVFGQIVQEFHCVVPLLHRLDAEVVGKAVQVPLTVEVGHIQIEIGGVELLVDLLVYQFCDFMAHHIDRSFLLYRCIGCRVRPEAVSVSIVYSFCGVYAVTRSQFTPW